jgi:hypothetical protein
MLLRAIKEGRCSVDYAVDVILAGPADWHYTPSCPCDRCEDHRAIMGMTCMFGLGPRPPGERRHRGLGSAQH